MQVTVKLYAHLGRHLPPHAVDNAAELQVTDGTTPADIIRKLNVPEDSCRLVLINGLFVPPSERGRRDLREHDVLAIWPPIAGG